MAKKSTQQSGMHLLQYIVLRAVVFVMRLLPYRLRIRFGGWLMARVLGPVAGFKKRIANNLDMICPDLEQKARNEIFNEVPDNFGRTLFEIFSGQAFLDHIRDMPFGGPGLDALLAAQAQGRPVIIVSGHFGNYDVIRGGLGQRGVTVGALYRKMANPAVNRFYVDAIGVIGRPLFERGRRGMGQMVRFLKQGGCLAILHDQNVSGGTPLQFFGRTAYTGLSAADLALKYDALLIPCYAIRQPDGLSFVTQFDPPIPHSDPPTMMQALNDGLEAQVRAHMGQWFWVHRRWRDFPHKTKP